jgi:hypothetical protein
VTLEDLGNIGELIGAIGVIASLVYLAAQIRQNTRTLRAATYESLAQATTSSNALLLTDPEIARIVETGLGEAALPLEDRARFAAYLRMTFRRYDSIYLHHRQATLPPEAWEAYWSSFRRILRSPNVRDFWDRSQEDYTSDFRSLVSQEVRRILNDAANQQSAGRAGDRRPASQ